jgi:hypothetical protein
MASLVSQVTLLILPSFPEAFYHQGPRPNPNWSIFKQELSSFSVVGFAQWRFKAIPVYQASPEILSVLWFTQFLDFPISFAS